MESAGPNQWLPPHLRIKAKAPPKSVPRIVSARSSTVSSQCGDEVDPRIGTTLPLVPPFSTAHRSLSPEPRDYVPPHLRGLSSNGRSARVSVASDSSDTTVVGGVGLTTHMENAHTSRISSVDPNLITITEQGRRVEDQPHSYHNKDGPPHRIQQLQKPMDSQPIEEEHVAPLQCEYNGCYESFKDRSAYQRHKQAVHPYCMPCDTDFKDKPGLRKHQTLTHDESEKFKYRAAQSEVGSLLDEAEGWDYASPTFQCEYDKCIAEFTETVEYKKHKHESHPYCKKCDLDFVTMSEVIEHREKKHKKKVVAKDSKMKIQEDIETPLNTKTWEQRQAEDWGVEPEEYHNKERAQQEEPKRFKCELLGCEERFTSIELYNEHRSKHPSYCKECNEIFQGIGILLAHWKESPIHRKKKPQSKGEVPQSSVNKNSDGRKEGKSSRDLKDTISQVSSKKSKAVQQDVNPGMESQVAKTEASIKKENAGQTNVKQSSSKEPDSFQCKYPACNDDFKTIADYRQHKLREHPYCMTCNKDFMTYDKLTLHSEKFHPLKNESKSDKAVSRVRTGDAAKWTKKLEDTSVTPRSTAAFKCHHEGCTKSFQAEKIYKIHKKTDHEYCMVCDLDFLTFDELLEHKRASNKHIACGVCGEDFISSGGRDRHLYVMHPETQDLTCIACGLQFLRAGSLVAHMEKNQCQQISSVDFEKYRAKTLVLYRSKSVFGDERDDDSVTSSEVGSLYGDSEGGVDLDDDTEDDEGRTDNGSVYGSEGSTFEDPPPSALGRRGKAPSVQSTRSGLLFPEVLRKSKNTEEKEFPVLGSVTTRERVPVRAGSATSQGTSAWVTTSSVWSGQGPAKSKVSSTLSPNAKSRVPAPSVSSERTHTDNLSECGNGKEKPRLFFADGQAFEACDPISKNFNPTAFLTPIGTYKCPKSFATVERFAAHLQSPSHTGVDHRCPGCLKIFKSPSALTQHMEASTTRCKIKASPAFGKVVNLVSGGFLDINGQNVDGTPRFENTEPKVRIDSTPVEW